MLITQHTIWAEVVHLCLQNVMETSPVTLIFIGMGFSSCKKHNYFQIISKYCGKEQFWEVWRSIMTAGVHEEIFLSVKTISEKQKSFVWKYNQRDLEVGIVVAWSVSTEEVLNDLKNCRIEKRKLMEKMEKVLLSVILISFLSTVL